MLRLPHAWLCAKVDACGLIPHRLSLASNQGQDGSSEGRMSVSIPDLLLFVAQAEV
jgi:hypothetical protein